MSNQPFGSRTSASTAYAPSLGLRQRHSSANAASNYRVVVADGGDENSNPNGNNNNNNDDDDVGGDPSSSSGSKSTKIRARPPPRASLASASGMFNTRRRIAATDAADRRRENDDGGASDVVYANDARALVPANKNIGVDEDLSLWVVGYGYRTEAHFRALYHHLSRCGVITARRGGLSCFGEETRSGDVADDGDNWVAVRYESALCAHKALCQHAKLASVGGNTVIFGVMPLNDPVVAAKLGIDVGASSSSSLSRGGGGGGVASSSARASDRRELKTEADILLLRDERMADGVVNDLDGLCGKVLAWFFMWD
ncbi:hypothetical protein ACHAW5_007124 [Stephanodiscus triporus]|uniref:RRM Nup35-type domain-containing protein n=1 Tax=Stephanodiscus triporus TaxID=2934178 RepID=A0ABD3NZ59_9STRA